MATIWSGMPGVVGLSEAVRVLRDWQYDAAPMQLHPGTWAGTGDSAEATSAAVRTWRRDGQVRAVGLLDGAELLRLTTAPDAQRDEELARQLVEDVTLPERGVLPAGKVAIEAPMGALVMDLLSADGWKMDEPWTPLRRDLTGPVDDHGLRIEVITPERAHVRTAVHRAAFGSPKFTDDRWHAMASGIAVRRCPVSGRVRQSGQCGGDGDGVVGRPRKTRRARADGRVPGPSRSRLWHGDDARRGESASGVGFLERGGLHSEFQRRRCRHLQVSQLTGTS